MDTQRQVSFEFFPPKSSNGENKLLATAKSLKLLNPDFFSVTFGAGGTTRERTIETVALLKKATTINTAPHLSCIDISKQQLLDILSHYQKHGVDRLVILRGDIPEQQQATNEFQYAHELVSFVRKNFNQSFWIEVACYPDIHPESTSAKQDFLHFVQKVQAGANSAITQYFYNADAFYHFLNECEKHQINIPIIPGIMPITQFQRLVQFSSRCGADMPQWLRRTLEDYQDCPNSLQAFGIDFVSRMCDDLLQHGARGLHFYTLNEAQATLQICDSLKLGRPVRDHQDLLLESNLIT